MNSARIGGVVLAAIVQIVAGCGNDGKVETDIDAFCAQMSANQTLIIAPPLESQEEINETIEFYELLQQLAPLEIEDDWGTLVEMIKTANEIVPGDPGSEQLVAQTAYASELAAYNIAEWVDVNCGVSLPITTIVSHELAPIPAPYDTYVPVTDPETGEPIPANSTTPDSGPEQTSVPDQTGDTAADQ